MSSSNVPKKRNIPSSNGLSGCQKRRLNKRSDCWTDRENRYVSTHRTDGYELVSEGLRALGCDRTPQAVKAHARRDLKIPLRRWPDDGRRRCVLCGRWYARPNTAAGRAGFCPTCWELRKTDAYREANSELAARRAYQRERKFKRTHIDTIGDEP